MVTERWWFNLGGGVCLARRSTSLAREDDQHHPQASASDYLPHAYGQSELKAHLTVETSDSLAKPASALLSGEESSKEALFI